MTTESFCTINELTEVPEGLRIEHHDGQTSLLRRENQRYARIEGLLRRAHRRGARWPVRIARTPDGVIENAWPAWPGRPIYVDDVVGPDECTVCFRLESRPKRVKHDNPNYPRMLETLMLAAAEKRDVFYFIQPGEDIVLADVCLADASASQAGQPDLQGG
jgi:hypothetical protein